MLKINSPSTPWRIDEPPDGWLAGAAHNESKKVEVEGRGQAFRKDGSTLVGELSTRPLDVEIAKDTERRIVYRLLNAETADVGSGPYARALAVTAQRVELTGADWGIYNHFRWQYADAGERWDSMQRAFRAHGVWPKHVVVSGHWRTARQGADLVRRVEADAAIVRRIVGRYHRVGVLTCPHRYKGGRVVGAIGPVNMRLVHEELIDRGFDVINWYQPELLSGTGVREVAP